MVGGCARYLLTCDTVTCAVIGGLEYTTVTMFFTLLFYLGGDECTNNEEMSFQEAFYLRCFTLPPPRTITQLVGHECHLYMLRDLQPKSGLGGSCSKDSRILLCVLQTQCRVVVTRMLGYPHLPVVHRLLDVPLGLVQTVGALIVEVDVGVFIPVLRDSLMGVGFARICLACESMRIANPHHRNAVLVYCAHAYEAPMAGRFRTISRRLANHCRICANPFSLRNHVKCESALQV